MMPLSGAEVCKKFFPLLRPVLRRSVHGASLLCQFENRFQIVWRAPDCVNMKIIFILCKLNSRHPGGEKSRGGY
jgi:hypothetical protein